MTDIYVVLGLAGSGKSTQSKLFADSYHFKWLSVGQLLRDKITGNLKKEMLTGKVLEGDIVTKIVEPELSLTSQKSHIVVLDGYPRNKEQTDWLIDQHNKGRLQIKTVIHIKTDVKLAKERLLSRGRQDDNEQAIAERFLEYENTIKPIVEGFVQNQILVVEVNGQQTIQEVQNELISSVGISKSNAKNQSKN